MTVTAGLRRLTLTVHLACSVGWIGAVFAYLALSIAAAWTQDDQVVLAAWIGMELTGWFVILPLAVGTLLTGVIISFAGSWGLFRHYWVLISLGLTILSTLVLLFHLPTVSSQAEMARASEAADLSGMGGDLLHPTVGLVVLFAIMALNIYKPRGMTAYGWRKQHEERELTTS